MKKRRKIIYLLVVMAILIGAFTQVDYNDLSLANNSGMYLLIIAMLLLIYDTVRTLLFEKY